MATVNEKMTALADVIRAKTGSTSTLTIDGMTAAVSGIVVGDVGYDTSSATVTADTLLAGVIAFGTNGAVTGNIPTVTLQRSGNTISISKGYVAENASITVEVDAGVDVSGVTATSADVLSGKYFVDSSGNLQQGAINIVSPSISANVVTVPQGYIAEQKTATIPEAAANSVSDNIVTVPVGYIKTQRTSTVAVASSPTVSSNEVTIYKGYQSTQKKLTVGTALTTQTYTPGTADQIIAADMYTTGAQVIKGDSNLLPENIKKGVTIFGIVGTYEATSSGGNDSGGSGDSGESASGANLIVAGVSSTMAASMTPAFAYADGTYPPVDASASGNARVWHLSNGGYDFYFRWSETDQTWTLAETDEDPAMNGFPYIYATSVGSDPWLSSGWEYSLTGPVDISVTQGADDSSGSGDTLTKFSVKCTCTSGVDTHGWEIDLNNTVFYPGSDYGEVYKYVTGNGGPDDAKGMVLTKNAAGVWYFYARAYLAEELVAPDASTELTDSTAVWRSTSYPYVDYQITITEV